MAEDCCCAVRHKVRDKEGKEYKSMVARLNRIEGQVRGVKNMVEEHFGGCIDVQSEPGNTCFTVRIPVGAIAYTDEGRAVHGERT